MSADCLPRPDQVTWTRYGVFWDGVCGSPIERLDDPEGAAAEIGWSGPVPAMEGDMDAALLVARHSDARYLAYFEYDDAVAPSWEVTAYRCRDEAEDDVAQFAGEWSMAFVFDGRTQVPTCVPGGLGYRPPAS
jgi:hypothetical protein